MAWECREGVKEVKAHLKLRLERDIEGSKKTFIVTSSSKRLNKENFGLLLHRVVTADTGEVLNAFLPKAPSEGLPGFCA